MAVTRCNKTHDVDIINISIYDTEMMIYIYIYDVEMMISDYVVICIDLDSKCCFVKNLY